MQILVNSNHSVEMTTTLQEHVNACVESELQRFDGQLTRVQVHLNDENSGKSGPQDKRCQMEARIKGHEPVSVTHKADSMTLAVDGAAQKLNHALAHALDKLNPY